MQSEIKLMQKDKYLKDEGYRTLNYFEQILELTKSKLFFQIFAEVHQFQAQPNILVAIKSKLKGTNINIKKNYLNQQYILNHKKY